MSVTVLAHIIQEGHSGRTAQGHVCDCAGPYRIRGALMQDCAGPQRDCKSCNSVQGHVCDCAGPYHSRGALLQDMAIARLQQPPDLTHYCMC